MGDFQPGDTVWVRMNGDEFPGLVLKRERSGYLLCEIVNDVDEIRTVAAAVAKVRARTIKPKKEESSDPDGYRVPY
jgi:hypothetical protein